MNPAKAMKKIQPFLFAAMLFIYLPVYAQVGIGTATPDASAKLDISSTTQGLLPPRMTTAQRDAIVSTATGLVIFNTTTNGLEFKSSTGWVSLKTSSDAAFLPTIVIGTQQWMEKNLDVLTYRNGDIIPQVTDPTTWAALTTGAWCYYNNDVAKGAIYGKLYNWYAVTDPRGLAPTGWHVPTDVEWTTLETTLGGNALAGGKIKTVGTTLWAPPNTGATNESSFAGLPGGGRYDDGTFEPYSFGCYWWSSTEHISNQSFAWFSGASYWTSSMTRTYFYKHGGFSVRCLRD